MLINLFTQPTYSPLNETSQKNVVQMKYYQLTSSKMTQSISTLHPLLTMRGGYLIADIAPKPKMGSFLEKDFCTPPPPPP